MHFAQHSTVPFVQNIESTVECLTIGIQPCYHAITASATARAEYPDRRRKDMDEMTSQELNQFLEAIAELIEAKAETVEQAAEIVRGKKINA